MKKICSDNSNTRDNNRRVTLKRAIVKENSIKFSANALKIINKIKQLNPAIIFILHVDFMYTLTSSICFIVVNLARQRIFCYSFIVISEKNIKSIGKNTFQSSNYSKKRTTVIDNAKVFCWLAISY